MQKKLKDGCRQKLAGKMGAIMTKKKAKHANGGEPSRSRAPGPVDMTICGKVVKIRLDSSSST
jgi:hypothetical protein